MHKANSPWTFFLLATSLILVYYGGITGTYQF